MQMGMMKINKNNLNWSSLSKYKEFITLTKDLKTEKDDINNRALYTDKI